MCIRDSLRQAAAHLQIEINGLQIYLKVDGDQVFLLLVEVVAAHQIDGVLLGICQPLLEGQVEVLDGDLYRLRPQSCLLYTSRCV